MEHAAYQVDILDKNGAVIHSKARRDVDKTKDIYHGVYIFLITPESDVLLCVIPPREDLPNLYSNTYGATLATIRRHDETAEQAAQRAISRELFIDDVQPIKIGEAIEQLPDGRVIKASVFYFKSATPDSYSMVDIGRLEAMSPKELDILVEANSKELSPTLKQFWQKYRSKLPL